MLLEVWNKLKQPPSSALRTIKGGRLQGFTDVNPQWRYQAMTEQFGICGIGWKYDIKRVWSEPAPDNQVFAFAEVNLFVRANSHQYNPLVNPEGALSIYDARRDAWSDPIPGIGGSMLVVKESLGLHASDEGYKMAITDALSVAMKMLGVAADIYAGLWDGSKYKETTQTVETPQEKPTPPKNQATAPTSGIVQAGLSDNKVFSHNITECKDALAWTKEQVLDFLGVEKLSDIKIEDRQQAIRSLQQKVDQKNQ